MASCVQVTNIQLTLAQAKTMTIKTKLNQLPPPVYWKDSEVVQTLKELL